MNRSSEPSLLHPQPPENYAVIRLIRWLDNWLTRFVPQEVKKKTTSSSLLLLWQLRHAEVFEFVFLITNNEICTPTTTTAAVRRQQRGGKEQAKEGAKREHRGSKEGASTLPLPSDSPQGMPKTCAAVDTFPPPRLPAPGFAVSTCPGRA